MADPLVTVTAYSAPGDAKTAKGVLDSAGIASVVDDAVERRVKVRVPNVDALRAGDVLTARGSIPSEIEEADEEAGERTCPTCGSVDIASARRGQTFALVATMAVALGVAIELVQAAFFAILATGLFLLMAGRWRCQTCGDAWD
jgi:hypothetical protein